MNYLSPVQTTKGIIHHYVDLLSPWEFILLNWKAG